MRSFTLQQIGEYYNTAHLLRPINPGKVSQYHRSIEEGAKFPPIVLGQYPAMDEKSTGRLIVDGNHVFRALQLAKAKYSVIEVVKYDSLADALADQLRRNMMHGYQITTAQRNARIKQLIEVYNWSTRQVAQAIGINSSSVSRIARGKQDISGTGKPGASTPAKKAASSGPGTYNPRQFLRAAESMALTLRKPETKAQTLAEIYNPKREPKEVQRLVSMLQELVDNLIEMVRQPVRASKAPSKAQSTAQLVAAA